MFEIIATIALVLSLAIAALGIYITIKVFAMERTLNEAVAQIKSKIGSLIKDINMVNRIEYDVDVDQDNRINNLAINKLS